MKRRPNPYQIKERTLPQCKLHQQLAQWAAQLDRPKDTQEVASDQPRTAPLHLLPMVF